MGDGDQMSDKLDHLRSAWTPEENQRFERGRTDAQLGRDCQEPDDSFYAEGWRMGILDGAMP